MNLMNVFKVLSLIAFCALQQASACTHTPPTVKVSSALKCKSTGLGVSDLCSNAVVSWYKNGELISGQNTTILSHGNLPSDEGSYTCGVGGVNSTSIDIIVPPRDVSKSEANMQQNTNLEFLELGELTKQKQFRGRVTVTYWNAGDFSCIFNNTLELLVNDRPCQDVTVRGMKLFSAVEMFVVGNILALRLTRSETAVFSGSVVVKMIISPLYNGPEYTASVDLTLLPLPTSSPTVPVTSTIPLSTPPPCNGPVTSLELTITLYFSIDVECDEQNTGKLVSGIEEVLSSLPCLVVVGLSSPILKCDSQELVLQIIANEELDSRQIKRALRSQEVIEGVHITKVIITETIDYLTRLEIICTVGFGFIVLLVLLGIVLVIYLKYKQRANLRDVRPAESAPQPAPQQGTKRRSNNYIETPLPPIPGPEIRELRVVDIGDQTPTASTDGSSEGERPNSTGFLVRPISLPPAKEVQS